MTKAAVLSPCRTWRYALERHWSGGPLVLFVGLNPSTADAVKDDSTIRRCIGFAREWGYGGLLVGNLFAFRATDPRRLREVDDPVGPANDRWLASLAARAALTIAAWGADPMAQLREDDVLAVLGDTHCLGTTKQGCPRHPLYLKRTARPELFSEDRNRVRDLQSPPERQPQSAPSGKKA